MLSTPRLPEIMQIPDTVSCLVSGREDLPNITEHDRESEAALSPSGGSMGFIVTGSSLERLSTPSTESETHQVMLH